MNHKTKFKNLLFNAVGKEWNRLGDKQLWTIESGDLVFGVFLFDDRPGMAYRIQVVYATREWLDGDLSRIICGGYFPLSHLLTKDDLELGLEYPGGTRNFEGLFLTSFWDNSSYSRNAKEAFPDLLDAEKRRLDYEYYFSVLKSALSQFKNLEEMRHLFGPKIDEGWRIVENNVRNCDGKPAIG